MVDAPCGVWCKLRSGSRVGVGGKSDQTPCFFSRGELFVLGMPRGADRVDV